jgi:hypothetical protein
VKSKPAYGFFKSQEKPNQTKSLETFVKCLWFSKRKLFGKEIHTLGYGFKKTIEIYSLAYGFLFFVIPISGICTLAWCAMSA